MAIETKKKRKKKQIPLFWKFWVLGECFQFSRRTLRSKKLD